MPRLITIPISHFCEIARWSLDHAGVAYEEEPHLQVLHAAAVRRVGGHRQTPVLVTEGGLVEGSVEILEWADQHRDPKQQSVRVSRAEMGELFGVSLDHYGAATRRLFYANVGECSTKLSMQINAQGAPRWERRVFRATYPLMMAFLRRFLDVNARSVAAAHELIPRCLDRVAARLEGGRPFLGGDTFSGADICFASLSAPLYPPPGYGIWLPRVDEFPAPVQGAFARYAEHPAMVHALHMYEEQRAAPARATAGAR